MANVGASHTVALSLGGEWRALAESETRHRSLLAQADDALTRAVEQLSHERTRSGLLRSALEHAGSVAAAATETALALEADEDALRCACERAQVGCTAFVRELARAEETVSELEEVVECLSQELEEERRAHEEERQQAAMNAAVLAETEAALRVSSAENDALKKELAEGTVRARRMMQQRQERERQMAVMLSEKQRLSALLSKKDAQARQLEFVLKKRGSSNIDAAPTAPAPVSPSAAPSASPRPATPPPRTARAATPTTPATTSPAALIAAAGSRSEVGPKGRWPQQAEALVSPSVPGVQQRFGGWREASPAQRGAALRSENAMLIALLAERDAALGTAHKEKEQVGRSCIIDLPQPTTPTSHTGFPLVSTARCFTLVLRVLAVHARVRAFTLAFAALARVCIMISHSLAVGQAERRAAYQVAGGAQVAY